MIFNMIERMIIGTLGEDSRFLSSYIISIIVSPSSSS